MAAAVDDNERCKQVRWDSITVGRILSALHSLAETQRELRHDPVPAIERRSSRDGFYYFIWNAPAAWTFLHETMSHIGNMAAENVRYAKQVPMRLEWTASSASEPVFVLMTVNWRAALSDLQYKARLDHDRPIRYEIRPQVYDLLTRANDGKRIEAWQGLPVVEASGPAFRLICEHRTYEITA